MIPDADPPVTPGGPNVSDSETPPDPGETADHSAAEAATAGNAATGKERRDEQARPAPIPEQVPAILEALLFVADGPVEPATLGKAIGLSRREVEGPLEALAESLRGGGLRLQRGPDGVQLVTAPLASSYVEQFLGLESAKRLSTAALETLAIIAYRQPVTRAQVEAIRGVNSDAAIDTLRTRGLVDITGRADGPGRPALFSTTQRFLEHFGLERPEDLPPLPEELAGPAAARLTGEGHQLPLPAGSPSSVDGDRSAARAPREAETALRQASGRDEHEEQGGLPRQGSGHGPHLPTSGASVPPGGAAGPPRPSGGRPPGSGAPRLG